MDNEKITRINRLLEQWRKGDLDAFDKLFEFLQAELQKIAHHRRRQERSILTLQTGDLVNELYLKMRKTKQVIWRNYGHLLSGTARNLWQLTVDHARKTGNRPQGAEGAGDEFPSDLAGNIGQDPEFLLALNKGLKELEEMGGLSMQIFNLYCVLGMTIKEITEATDIGKSDVARESLFVRKFLAAKLSKFRPGKH